jgi:RND family efflux transporter MFP subunit
MKRLLILVLLLPMLATAAEWTTRPLSELAVYPEFRAPASVAALDEARIAAEVAGRVEALPVRGGQAVAKGGELARLDAAAHRIAADHAAAQVELIANRVRLAEAQLAQSKALAARGFISADGLKIKETELSVLKSERSAARQALAAARLDVARTVVRAPYAGVVRERLANVGDLAAPGTPLLVLSASADTEVRARVPAAQIEGLRAAAGWQLVAGGTRAALRLTRVSPVVEAAGQAHEVVFAVDAPLAPGLAGELRWTGVVAHLPAAYVQQRGSVLGAFVARDGRPAFVAIPGAQAGRPAPVDWPPDTPVIDDGRFAIGLPANSARNGP